MHISTSHVHTAGRARTGITGLLALLVGTLAKVVGTAVNNNGAAKDALRADQLDELVGNGALSVALAISLEVAQITNVTLRVGWGAVRLAVRVDCFCQSSADPSLFRLVMDAQSRGVLQ